MRHFLLLAFKQRLLLRQLGDALAFERAVVAGVLVEAFLLDMDNLIHHRIEEVAVVRDQDQRAFVAF